MTAPGVNVTVTTEVGYCPFCQRTRNLRREERHLGGLVRMIVTCESCNRTLSNTMVPEAPPEAKPVRAPVATKTRKAAAKKPAASSAKTKKPATSTKKATTTKKTTTKKK